MHKDENVIKVLNELVLESEDGQKGFQEASKIATESELKALLAEGAQECAQAVGELQEAIRLLGSAPPDRGSVPGVVHRGWTKVRSAVEDPNVAVLEEVERGEDHAKTTYAKALKTKLPPEIRAVVERQQKGVLRHHDRVKTLRDSYRAMAH